MQKIKVYNFFYSFKFEYCILKSLENFLLVLCIAIYFTLKTNTQEEKLKVNLFDTKSSSILFKVFNVMCINIFIYLSL